MKNVISILFFLLLAAPSFAADLVVTQGDTITFQLVAMGDDDSYHDLTGASFVTTLKGVGGAIVSISDSAHTEAANQVTDPGEFTLSLTAAQTALLQPGKGKEILTKVTQGGNIRHFRASILTVLPAVPAQ